MLLFAYISFSSALYLPDLSSWEIGDEKRQGRERKKDSHSSGKSSVIILVNRIS